MHSRINGSEVAVRSRKPRSVRLAVEMLEGRLTPSTAPLPYAVSPNAAPAGTVVEVLGWNFTPGAQVLFGTTPATLSGTQSDSTLTVVVPSIPLANSEVTVSNITVVNGDGQQAVMSGVFYALPYALPTLPLSSTTARPTLTISSVSPASGLTSGGGTVEIDGNGFEPDSRVLFGDVVGQVTSSTPTTLTVTVPALPDGTLDITVTNADGQQAILPGAFVVADAPQQQPVITVQAPESTPVITSISPSTGAAPGTMVQIFGTGFQPGAEVLVAGVAATPVGTQTDTTLTVTIPALPAGPADVIVINPDGQEAVLPSEYLIAAALPAPVVTSGSFSAPDSVSGQVTLTLSGSGFSPDSQVLVGGVPATVNGGATPTTLTVTLASQPPAGSDIVVINPDGQQTVFSGSLINLAAPPVIYAVSPGGAAANGEVGIFGANFQPNVKVFIEGVSAVLGDIVTSGYVVAIVPSGLPTGSADVTIVNADGQQVTMSGSFMVLPSDLIIVP